MTLIVSVAPAVGWESTSIGRLWVFHELISDVVAAEAWVIRVEPYGRPANAGLILPPPDVPASSKGAGAGSSRTSTKRDLLFVCQQRCDIFYPSLVDKTYPGDYTSGAICPATTPRRWLWTPGGLTPRSRTPLSPLTFVSFTPRTWNLYPSSSPPPLPRLLLPHVQIKKWAPFSLVYWHFETRAFYRRVEGKIIGSGFN